MSGSTLRVKQDAQCGAVRRGDLQETTGSLLLLLQAVGVNRSRWSWWSLPGHMHGAGGGTHACVAYAQRTIITTWIKGEQWTTEERRGGGRRRTCSSTSEWSVSSIFLRSSRQREECRSPISTTTSTTTPTRSSSTTTPTRSDSS